MEECPEIEEDIDIYEDLSVDKSVEQCKKCSELESQIEENKKKFKKLQKLNHILEKNMSSLLLTAKSEVARKDRMIADLRRQLDNASFRRGNFKYDRNFESNINSGPNEAHFGNDEAFNPNRLPPPLPEDFKPNIPPPLPPENFHPDIPPPPLYQNFQTEDMTPRSPDIHDEEAEFICKPDPYFEEEEVPEVKYGDVINRDTLFSKRLRKRLEEEDKLERKEKEQKAILEEAARKENEKLRIAEAERKENERLRIVEAESKENERRRLEEVDRKENERFRLEETERLLLEEAERKENVRFRLEEVGRKENERHRLEEAERKENEKLQFEETRGCSSKIYLENKENKPGFVNTSTKRLRNYEEQLEVKRPKMEPINDPDHDDYREDWGDGGSEFVKIKEEPESLRLDYDKKYKEAEDCTSFEVRNNLASRLHHLSEGASLESTSRNDSRDGQNSRKDSGKRKEDEKRSREKEKYEKEKYENDRYKDKFLRERYEKDKYKEKLERERHERDKFDKEWYKQERDKFEKEKFDREKYERKLEKNRLDRKRFRRSLSFSPERTKFLDKRESRQKGFKLDEFNIKGKGRNERFEWKTDLRQKISRSTEQDNYQSRKGREILKKDFRRSRSNSFDRNKREFRKGSTNSRSRSSSKEKIRRESFTKGSYNSRSRSNSKDKSRRENELRRRIFNSERSRSSSKDKSYINQDKKITLKDYKERTDRALVKENPTERCRSNSKDIDQRMEERKRILEMQKARLEMELRKFETGRSRSSSKEKDCNLYSREITEKAEAVKVSLSKDRIFSDTSEKSRNKDMEEGELSDSSNLSFSFSQIYETNQKVSQKPLDNSEKKMDDKNHLRKAPVEKSIDKSKVERENKIKNISDKLSQQTRDSKSLSLNKVLVDDQKKLVNSEGTSKEKSKEKIDPVTKKETSFASQLQNKSKTSKVEIDSKLCEPTEKVVLSKLSEENSDKKLNSKLEVNPKDDIEKCVESLDSFIESANKVLEENKKEGNRKVEVARKEKEKQLQEEFEKELTDKQQQVFESEGKINVKPKEKDLNKIVEKKQKLSKNMKDLFSPVKKKKSKRAEFKERKEEKNLSQGMKNKNKRRVSKEIEGEILSPLKENKEQKRNESKESVGKEVCRPVEDIESKEQKLGETEIRKPIKEDLEIKPQDKEYTEIKTQKKEITESRKQSKEDSEIKMQNSEDPENTIQKKEEKAKAIRPLKELNPQELKKEDNKISSHVRDQREQIEPEVEVPSNSSSSIKERRKQIEQKEAQNKLIDAQNLLKEPEQKPKQSKKQVQKVKEVVAEKPKTKKAEEKPKKKIVVVVKKRRRPPVLSDSNASTTIVSNKNVIMNINLNNSGDKNLLS